MANPVNHEPRTLVRDPHHPMKLMGADSFLAGAHEIDCLKPLVQWDMRTFEDGSNRDRELLPAMLALEKSRAGRGFRCSFSGQSVHVINASTMRTYRLPVGPSHFLDVRIPVNLTSDSV